MILRRLTQHLKDQNWFAVWLDLFIVVVGVFIGIQVANWNEDRVLNSKSEHFTERLKSDLRDEAWNFRYLVEYYDDVLATGYRTLDALNGKSQISDEALLINAYRATQFTSINRSRSTFDELISTGMISLIRDNNLHNTAMMVYDDDFYLDIEMVRRTVQYRNLFRMHIPLYVQDVLLSKCGDKDVVVSNYENIVDVLDYPCVTDLPPELIATSANIIRSEVSLVPLLRLRLANVRTLSYNLTFFNPELILRLQSISNEKNDTPLDSLRL